MRVIHLHGDLARFGGPFSWDVASPAEAVRALCRMVPGFRARLSDGNFHVVSGPIDVGLEHDRETLALRGQGELHFVPAIEGAGGNRGFIKIIAAAALVATSFALGGPVAGGITAAGITTQGVVATLAFNIGLSVALAGVAQLLAPTPGVDSNESPDERPSFVFNSLINRQEAGAPVPLVFGRFRVGSVVASAGIAVEQVPYGTEDGSNSDKFYGKTGR